MDDVLLGGAKLFMALIPGKPMFFPSSLCSDIKFKYLVIGYQQNKRLASFRESSLDSLYSLSFIAYGVLYLLEKLSHGIQKNYCPHFYITKDFC